MSSTDTQTKVVRQIEYYFSDSNFPNDKFLKEEAAKNQEGYVNIDIIASFNKMKQLTTDLQLITDALKGSNKLQVSEDGKMVRRVDPLPDNEELMKKTFYSKGWPLITTVESVEEFFGKYGKVLSVRLRKNKDRSFKGSLMVDMESEEIVAKIIAEAPKVNEHELIYQTYKQFAEEKKQQEEQYKLNKVNKKRKGEKDSEEAAPEEMSLVSGTILAFKSIGSGVRREDLKVIFSQYGEVEHIDFYSSNDFGSARYKTPESAKRALEAMTTEKKELGGKVPELSVLEGEDEQKEFERIKNLKKQKKFGGNKKFGRKGGNFKSNKKQRN